MKQHFAKKVYFHTRFILNISAPQEAYLSAAEISAYISIIYSNITFNNTTLRKIFQVVFDFFTGNLQKMTAG